MQIKDVCFLPDPCPLPEQLKKRALVERERLIYAPFSGVGGIVYDKDAVYVELGGSHSHTKDDTGLVTQLLQTQETLDHKLEKSELQFFTDSAPIRSEDVKQIFSEEKIYDQGRVRRKVVFNDSQKSDDKNENDEDNEDDDEDESEEEMDVEDNEDNLNIERANFTSESKENYDQESDDEEDENNEEDEEDQGEGSDEKVNQSKKRKLAQKSPKKKMKLDPSDVGANAQVYRELRINQDKHVKDKISEALSLIGDISSRKSPTLEENHDGDFQDNDESFDELSDDEEMDFELKLENESGDEDKEKDAEGKSDNEDEEDDCQITMKWKENIAQRAREAFLDRQQSNVNVMKVVYGVFDDERLQQQDTEEPEEEGEEVGGIFKVMQAKQKQKVQERELKNQEESVFFTKEFPRDWLEEDNKTLLVDRFVTGKWKESEDAEEVLKLCNFFTFII